MVKVEPINILFAGGGTGGHLFPGITVARELMRRHPHVRITFVGSGRTLETRVLSREGFNLEKIRTISLVGQSVFGFFRGLVTLPISFLDTMKLLRRLSPNLVIGLGGYSSGPVVLLAALGGLPTLLLEQNAVPGMTNRILAKVVNAIAVAYRATLPYFGTKGVVSGNPVRASFFNAPILRESPSILHVLVIGGSQGAHTLNMCMIEAIQILLTSKRPIRITHQAGESDLEFIRESYRQGGVTAHVESFLDDIDLVMAEADLVVCRAGAMTLAELAASGRPAILVPFPHAAHDHQRRNALVLVEAGAAELVDPEDLNGATLGKRIISLGMDDERRKLLASACRKFAIPEATSVIVNRVELLIGLNDKRGIAFVG